ncbi:unnamed protein product [Larinioides sclopetarius]|uniref:Maturase K n=1 Tax=Larinioides sclopetarius TaxID=280406 RepID=A0AAV2A2N5_9ARAC
MQILPDFYLQSYFSSRVYLKIVGFRSFVHQLYILFELVIPCI